MSQNQNNFSSPFDDKLDQQQERLNSASLGSSKKLSSALTISNEHIISDRLQRSTYNEEDIDNESTELQKNDKPSQKKQSQIQESLLLQKPKYNKELHFEQGSRNTIKLNQRNLQNEEEGKNEEKQEYESISSDRSQEERIIDEKEIQNENIQCQKSHQSHRSLSNKGGNYLQEKKQELRAIQMKSQSKMLQQSIPIDYLNYETSEMNEKNTHATFNVQDKKNKQSQKVIPNYDHNRSKKITSLNDMSSSNNSKYSLSKHSSTTSNKVQVENDDDNQSSKSGSRPYEQLKYPSIIMNSQKEVIKSQSIHSKKSQQQEQSIDLNAGNSFISEGKEEHRNYALTMKMKKVTSQQSFKRPQSLESKKLVSSHQGKSQSVKYLEHKEKQHDFERHSVQESTLIKSSQKSRRKNQLQRQQQPTQPNLFYVSTSNQEMYPTLDLKNTNNIKNIHVIQQEQLQNQKQHTKSHNHKNKNYKQKIVDLTLPCRVKISQYRSQYFLKVQTQVFTLNVEFPPSRKQIQLKQMGSQSKQQTQQQKGQVYSIQRRFTDFAFLNESISTNHLGYIIYPFPQKTLQSFVKIKLQSLIGNTILNQLTTEHEAQKMQLIQRRIQELQNFVNFLLQHEQLRNSQQLAIFLTPDNQLYNKSKQRIAKYVEQYKELQSSGNILQEGKKNIKKVIETGYGMVMKWWGSSQTNNSLINNSKHGVKNSHIGVNLSIKDNEKTHSNEFVKYAMIIETCYAKYHMLQKSLNKLIEMYKNLENFKDIDTEFDYLVKLCAKLSSGKEYTKSIRQAVTEDILREVQLMRRWLEQTKGNLSKRQAMISLIQQLKQSQGYGGDLTAKISKLQRRLDRFDKNFRFGFDCLVEKSQATFIKCKEKFAQEWQLHCKNMQKIWK